MIGPAAAAPVGDLPWRFVGARETEWLFFSKLDIGLRTPPSSRSRFSFSSLAGDDFNFKTDFLVV